MLEDTETALDSTDLTSEVSEVPAAPEPTDIASTIRRTYDNLKGKNEESTQATPPVQGSEGQTPAEPAKAELSEAAKTLNQAKKTGKKVVEGAQLEPIKAPTPEQPAQQLNPPERWPVKDKEEFNKLPQVAQKQILDYWKRVEGEATKGFQDLSRHKQRYQQLDQLVNHYTSQWNLNGMTDVQAIAELCAAQDYIIKDPLHGLSVLLEKTGITPEQLYQYQNSGGKERGQPAQPQLPPEFNQLTSQVQQIQDMIRANQEAQQNAVLQTAVDEVNTVRYDRDVNGSYKWPELHDESYLQTRVKPLVEDLRKTQPGISWSEATKRAVNTLRILDGKVSSPSSQSQSLTPTQQELERAKAASVSIRGRGVNGLPTMDLPQGSSIQDAIRASLEQLRQH